jgi:hypothetical protein
LFGRLRGVLRRGGRAWAIAALLLIAVWLGGGQA